VDDALAIGGSTRALLGEDAHPWRAIAEDFRDFVTRAAITARTSTTVAAIYGDDVLVVGDAGAEVLTARATVIATGAHDGGLAFEGNDVPGVMSARAAGWLLARGVAVGARVVIVVDPHEGSGPFGEAYARARRAADAGAEVQLVRGAPLRVEGSSVVKAVTVRDASGVEARYKADALVLDAPRAPAYEQAGAALAHVSRGYMPKVTRGKIRDRFFAVGEVTGAPFDAAGVARAVEEVVSQL
jgi:sarcosine oxidase subunit alpha